VRTGRAERRLPSAAGAPPIAAGMTRLTIRETLARRVDVAGDFSNWKAIATTRAPNGVWFIDLRIPPGQYRYAFRIDGTTWAVPDGASTVNDGFGGKSAWLTVSETPNGSTR
jgi:1,4-alpha-glucan branching enzyme